MWVEGFYHPGWIKGIQTEIKMGLKGDKGYMMQPVFRSAKPAKASNTGSGQWEMLSLEQALKLIEWMAEPLPVENILCILQKSRKMKNLAYANRVHDHACNDGLEQNVVGNYVVPMFVDCGSIFCSQKIFNGLLHRNEHSWTSIILGHVASGQSQHALNMYQKMQEDKVHPSSHTLMILLRACAKLKDLDSGRQVHAEVTERGYGRDLFIGNTLIDMYGKCDSLTEAREVFDKLPFRDIVSWNALISGYTDNGHGEMALQCLEQMKLAGFLPDAVTLFCGLKACSTIGALANGQEIHKEIVRRGFDKNVCVGNTLIDMYVRCDSLTEARSVFDGMAVRDIISWNALIVGYVENGCGDEAIKCFELMQHEGIQPDAVMFVCILKACRSIGAIDKGREIHNQITARGFEKDLFVGSTLVSMYAKCGALLDARKVFNMLTIRDVVAWTSLITGYIENGLGEDALSCFAQMQQEGMAPDIVTFVCILKACSSIGAIDKGREIHTEIARRGLEKDLFIGNTLVDMYANCGSLVEAWEVFDKLPVRDIVSWNALIAGYAENGLGQEALKCVEEMQLHGVPPQAITFVCGLKACGNIGAIDKGREIHTKITEEKLEGNIFIGNTLIDMYSKFGSLAEAQASFDRLPVQDIVSWNAMIRGYGMNHESSKAIQCFESMQEQGLQPDAITFLCLLSTCSHANLVFKGQEYFQMMQDRYHIEPTIDHFTCMIDLLARSGYLDGAKELLEGMPFSPSRETWTCLLNACKIYGAADLGLRCFQKLVEMNPDDAAPYVLMANIYTTTGKWEAANRIEEFRKHAGAKKKPARAFIEVNKKVHEFVVGNSQSVDILTMLETLTLRMKNEGYMPDIDFDLRPISDQEKEAALCGHAEKFAIAFGLLHAPDGQALHVTKNLRMCNDCHNASKIISKMERRDIILRESNWVHHFRKGICSCEGH